MTIPAMQKKQRLLPLAETASAFLLFKLYSTTCFCHTVPATTASPILSEKCLSAEPYGVFVFFFY